MTFRSTKTWGNDRGFSCAFRQWRATHSHCSLLHGYALGFKFIFEAETLDEMSWVVDFGGMDSLKETFTNLFDHTTIVATDDPEIEWFREAHTKGMLNLVELPAVGCERFADLAYRVTQQWLEDKGYAPRVFLVSVEVSEHGANSATKVGQTRKEYLDLLHTVAKYRHSALHDWAKKAYGITKLGQDGDDGNDLEGRPIC